MRHREPGTLLRVRYPGFDQVGMVQREVPGRRVVVWADGSQKTTLTGTGSIYVDDRIIPTIDVLYEPDTGDELAVRLSRIEARLRSAQIHDPDCPAWLNTQAQAHTGAFLGKVPCTCWLTDEPAEPALEYGDHGWPGKWRHPVPPGRLGDVWSKAPFSEAVLAKVRARFGIDLDGMVWMERNPDGSWPNAGGVTARILWTEPG